MSFPSISFPPHAGVHGSIYYRYWYPRYMCRQCLNMCIKGCCHSAVSAWTYAKFIDPLNISFSISAYSDLCLTPSGFEQCALRCEGNSFEIAADADPKDYRGTRVGTSGFYSLYH